MTDSDPSPTPPTRRSSLAAWAQLLRLPNLFTVPGDPLAGFVLAGGLSVAADLLTVLPCAAASVLLYCAGMILNDVFDRKQDARDRPGRPIPAGQVSVAATVIIAVALAAGGIALAALVSLGAAAVAAALALAVLAYDAVAKRIRILGPVTMGLCRGLSLLLGATAAGAPGMSSSAVTLAGALLTGYIALVTYLAAFEAGDAHRRGPLRKFRPEAVQKAIGIMIRLLVVYQAAVVATAGVVGCILAACLLAGGVVSTILAKRFYAS